MTAILILASLVAADACRFVDGPRILGRDLAAAAPAFSAIAGDAAVGHSPLAGVERILRPADLARIARENGLSVTGPVHDVCFVRAAAPVSEAALRMALERALAMPAAKIEILDYSRNPVPRGEIEFARSSLLAQPALTALSPDAPLMWRGRVREEGGRSAPIWARVRVLVEQTWVEAVKELPAGAPIAADDLRLASGSRFPLAPGVAIRKEDLAGKAPLHAIPAGRPLAAAMFREPRLVESGDAVAVEVHSGEARIVFAGRAESGGRAGDRILVRNPENGRRFSARIEAKGKVVVETKIAPRVPSAGKKETTEGMQ